VLRRSEQSRPTNQKPHLDATAALLVVHADDRESLLPDPENPDYLNRLARSFLFRCVTNPEKSAVLDDSPLLI
jgi:hypothetical protein